MAAAVKSSQAALDLTIREEVSSEAYYKQKLRRPTWPGEQSGATVAIGYDLGQTAKATVIEDWRGRVPEKMLEAMLSACGATGARGKTAAARIRARVDIPWETAVAVFYEKTVPRWEAVVTKALPNTDKLPPDCFGALLSLTFNRGPSFSRAGERYQEMRAIKQHMQAEEFAAIPGEFRAMKRLWPNSSGLRKRRDTEAKLFERGLSAPHNQESVSIEVVQRRLDALGFHEVGTIDGKWGGKTAGAIAAFKNDRHLVDPAEGITPLLTAELDKAEAEKWTRPIAPARGEATEAEVARQAPEMVPVQQNKWMAMVGSLVAVVGSIISALGSSFIDALSWLGSVKAFFADVPGWAWFAIAAGIALLFAINSWRGTHGIATAFRTGERN